MTEKEIFQKITEFVEMIAVTKGTAKPRIAPDTTLLGGGLPIDSLDLAGLIVVLEQATGYDPFKKGFVNFRTIGELVKLYEQEGNHGTSPGTK